MQKNAPKEQLFSARQQPAGMTVVFDAGQNSQDNFAHLAGTSLRYVGSVPASDCPDLTSLPASARAVVDAGRFGALTAFDTRRVVYGAERRAILTHSPELRDSQARGFDGSTLAKAGKKLEELARPKKTASVEDKSAEGAKAAGLEQANEKLSSLLGKPK